MNGMNNEFIFPVRVYIEDTDAGGIVFYVNYLKFMERARTELFRKLGFEKPALIADGLLLVVASSNISYKKPAQLDDELLISARVIKLARSYLELEQKVYRQGELLCEGQIKVACVTKERMKPSAMPENVQRSFRHLMNHSK